MNALVMVVFVLCSLGAALYGLAHLSQATLGVGIICVGAVFAILARIAQSGGQHAKLVAKLEGRLLVRQYTADEERVIETARKS